MELLKSSQISVGKLYHQILADRTIAYLLGNGLIDNTTQKAFLPDVNGCVEHSHCLREIISHARHNKRTVHVTFFDLADAFGSVSHELMIHTLKRNGLPPPIVSYVHNLYSRLSGYVQGPGWKSDTFRFRKGTFQGDPFSPVLFIMVFNPIIQYLKQFEPTHGYLLNGHRYITLPYADDFILVTTDKRRHQKMMNDIARITSSMNLQLKPPKCKTLSICGGRSKEVPFSINDNVLTYVKDKPEKFLGSWITYEGTTQVSYSLIHDKIKAMLDNIDSSLVRSEYKLNVYVKYVLSSVKFALTVHDFTKTQVVDLDALSTRYIKKWLNIPPHGATSAILFSKHGLAIPQLSAVYAECHGTSIAHCLTRADERVASAVQHKLDREAEYTSKSYGNVAVAELVKETQTEKPEGTWNHLKSNIKKKVQDEHQKKWYDKIQELMVQGKFLELLALQDEDLTWKGIIYNLPHRVLSFAVRAAIDALPTFRNLQRWGKRMTGRCVLCGNSQTLHHVLNGCKTMLDQGRYTWRHNAILQYMWQVVRASPAFKDGKVKVNVDLPGQQSSTIPIHILPCSDRPDLVILYPDEKKLVIVELTVPFETNIESSHNYKINKYCALVNDLTDIGYNCDIHCIEIGSRGFISKENRSRLQSMLCDISLKKQFKHVCNNISKLALVTSYAIFKLKDEPQWTDSAYIGIPANDILA